MSEVATATVSVAEFVSKRVERLTSFERACVAMASDLKEMKYQIQQWDAKIKTNEGKILGQKEEMRDLEEQIRRKKIEVAGSFNNIRDDLQRRELALVKREAELVVRENQVKIRANTAEELINKAERVIGKQHKPEPVVEAPAPVVAVAVPEPVLEKRGPGRPKKEAASA